MKNTYFHRVHKETPTRLWINNPTLEEASLAIEAGAEYCTTNPTYSIKMLENPEMERTAKTIVRDIISNEPDDSLACSAVQGLLAKKLMDVFNPVYTASSGTRGWVSIQGDPEKEDDSTEILREAEKNLHLGKNYIAKIPVTKSGLEAIAQLSAEGIPVIATEVMSLSQAVNACETYVKAIGGLKKPAPCYVTHITGIFDQHLGEWKKGSNVEIENNVLWYGGILAGRKQYQTLKDRKYPVTMLGGGARGLHHFTEFVGADMHITINWKGSADRLIRENPPVENRFDKPIGNEILEELLEKVPVFKSAWSEEELAVEEYDNFPPVILFRSMFLDGWKQMKKMISEKRNEK